MLQKTKLPYTRLFAFLLAVFIAIGALFSSVKPVHALMGLSISMLDHPSPMVIILRHE